MRGQLGASFAFFKNKCCTATSRRSLATALEGALDLVELAPEGGHVGAGGGRRLLRRRWRRRRRGWGRRGVGEAAAEAAQEEAGQRVGGGEGDVGEGVVGADGLRPLLGLEVEVEGAREEAAA